MEFPTALAIMHNDNDRCFKDSDRHAIYKIVDDELTIWVNPVQEWRAVKEDISDLMKCDFEEVSSPSEFKFTFTQAIKYLKTGHTMCNTQYPNLVYTYSPINGVDRFVAFDRNYDERIEHSGFTSDEIESMWGFE